MKVLKTGVSAYYDSISGPVPVKVLSIDAPAELPAFDLEYGQAKASIRVCGQVTANHSPYKKGEIIESNSISMFPKESLRKHQLSFSINPYTVQVDQVPV